MKLLALTKQLDGWGPQSGMRSSPIGRNCKFVTLFTWEEALDSGVHVCLTKWDIFGTPPDPYYSAVWPNLLGLRASPLACKFSLGTSWPVNSLNNWHCLHIHL
ncbi:hypothetical protein H6P81_020416 [Aristolochia fimbriata]|uniref:Uncharacterized protein n=1 Tax=Aristolochia fimbriata TaxID=158543 RepID=A0AAV7DXD3_ARIFI|nr:hypothetical protein H6P81_020416 [Aristolochia fimbriata]